MPLAPNLRLGPYQIVAPLGAGGMGEVYKGRDTRLDRIVAIKVLPEHSAARPDLRERFEREARAVSALNHPHICALYDVGQQDGIDFLVMEYLEGETLAQRLERGPLPMEQALRYAVQISDALERAHRHKVIHRDLKPSNIMLVRDGAKLLDFGLAKLHAAAAAEAETRTIALTTEGTILGTFQYMAPEQLEGKDADVRSDIFAFGAVLYEMVTGRKAFEGKSRASITAAIMERDPPPVSQVQPLTAPLLEKLIKTCLAKDPEQRRQTAHDVLLDLKWISEQREQAAEAASAARPQTREFMAWIAAALMAILCIASLAWVLMRPGAPAPRVNRFTIRAPQGTGLGGNWWWYPSIAISPDAAYVALIATRQDVQQIHLRALGEWDAHPISETTDAHSPFFSPDGRWLGMVMNKKIVKVSVTGGPPITIASLPGESSGAYWGPGDTIYYDLDTPTGIMKVSASGGTPQAVTALDPKKQETSHRYPEILPDGKALLLTVRTGEHPSFDEAEIQTFSLVNGERRTIIKGGTNAHFVSTGHLLFVRAGVLMAVGFDPVKLEVKGSPLPVLEHVLENPRVGAGQISIARDGTLAYIPGGTSIGDHELVFVDRAGAARVLTSKPRPYEDFTLSPDGRMIATTIEGAITDTWIYDIGRDAERRFTFGVEHRDPIWSPDGKQVVYDGYQNGKWCLFSKPANGSGIEELLLTSQNPVGALGWTPDRRFFMYNEYSATTGSDIMMIPMEGDRKPRPVVQTQFFEEWANLSPDGRWVAYTSDESGKVEVYVIPFPGNAASVSGKWRISLDGGERPQWAPNGRELYYYSRATVSEPTANVRPGERLKMIAVPIETQAGFQAGKPHVLFEGPYFDSFHDYAPTPDGRGFIMIRETQSRSRPTEFGVVLGWFEDLKRIVPVK